MAGNEATIHGASLFSRIKAVFFTWISNPMSVASVCPSSSVLTREIADRSVIRDADLVIDLGPATGETCVALLEQMKPSATLLAIEKMSEFIEPLSEIKDDRLIVQHGDAIDLGSFLSRHKLGKPDVIVSGIPFSTMDEAVATEIVQQVRTHLSNDGTFIAYQLRNDVVTYARPLFGEPAVQGVQRNIPPLTVYTWTNPNWARHCC